MEAYKFCRCRLRNVTSSLAAPRRIHGPKELEAPCRPLAVAMQKYNIVKLQGASHAGPYVNQCEMQALGLLSDALPGIHHGFVSSVSRFLELRRETRPPNGGVLLGS